MCALSLRFKARQNRLEQGKLGHRQQIIHHESKIRYTYWEFYRIYVSYSEVFRTNISCEDFKIAFEVFADNGKVNTEVIVLCE